MSSLISGYEYDIFISYRQKDNKGDRWVSEFVEALKTELESTFKEEISVYFDINPHDGLLETHDVDESLKEKLKCLVFIPIISRTYCDPKSFAWEHEFKAFVEQASQDQFGLKVKLPNGNVASRVLPVRIYDLDIADVKLCESVLGGVLRGLDFVFRSPGVNRPLKPSDDPDKNLTKTFYRDQINKVANAVKETIYCLNPESNKQIDQLDHPVIKLQDLKESIQDSSTGHFTEIYNNKSIFSRLASEKQTIMILSFVIVLTAILGLWGLLRSGSDGFDKLTTYATIPVESKLMDAYGQLPYFSISPDGRTIAIGSEKGLLLRSLSDFSVKVLEGTERTTQIVYSPDGQSLAFEKDDYIYKINITGSQKSIIYSKGSGSAMFWGIDGYIYFCPGFGSEGIWRISVNGGEPEQITSVIDSLGENSHRYPQLLPDSKTLLFTALGPSNGSLDSRIIIQNLKSGERKILVDKAIYGRYLFNGNILFANNEGYIFTIPFNIHKIKIKGEPKAVLSGVNISTSNGSAFLAVSETGNLIFLLRNNTPLNVVDVVDRSGQLIDNDSIPLATLERMGHGTTQFRISPSGNLLVFTGRSYSSADLWVLSLDTRDAERITFDPAEDEYPVWSPDGNTIAYTSAMAGSIRRIFTKDYGSASDPHLIRIWPRHIHFTSWSPDGKWLIGHDYTSTNGTDCYVVSVNSNDSIPIANSGSQEWNGQFSPDGRWIAFESNESGRPEIYIISFPKLEGKRQISEEGGRLPLWDRNGKFIYYISNGFMIEQPVELSDGFKKGKPIKLFFANALNFDLSPDGKKFYLTRSNVKRPNPPLHLIINWFQELETKTDK
jgi:Tol biopolymer transport system component